MKNREKKIRTDQYQYLTEYFKDVKEVPSYDRIASVLIAEYPDISGSILRFISLGYMKRKERELSA